MKCEYAKQKRTSILNEIYSTNMAHILAALHSIRKFVIKQSNFSLFPVVGVLCSCSVCIHTFCVEKLDMNMIVHCLLCQREWTRCCFAVSCTPAMYEYKRIGHAKKVVEYLSMMLYGGH